MTSTFSSHPVDLLASAIATREGFFVKGSIPSVRNNPGDLYFEGQLNAKLPPAGQPDPEIAAFPSLADGITALYRQLWLQAAEGQTVRQICMEWSGNDPAYLPDILEWTDLPADVPVLQLLPPLQQMNLKE